jgi:type 1 glutamine amidotransferase
MLRKHLAINPGLWIILLTVMCSSGVSAGSDTIDCPLRKAPYSVDSPLIDVLLKPEAKAALEGMLPGIPTTSTSPTSPTFSAIVTVRTLAELTRMPPETLQRIDATLSGLIVTAADEQARCARYDVDNPRLQIPQGRPRLLLFEKITGFRDSPSVEAARASLIDMAGRNGWAIVATDKGGAITRSNLKKFDAVIWNNVSGDVLTRTQREAFKSYVEGGGGFVGLHGSAGDPVAFWDWYVDTLVGARFAGHPMSPQFQQARVVMAPTDNGIGQGLPAEWVLKDEWYSFKASPRLSGAKVIATLDESSYAPLGMMGKDLRMGDHPIVWSRCIEDGRAFYSAIGHLPEVYADSRHQQMLKQAIRWAAGVGKTRCRDGTEIPR